MGISARTWQVGLSFFGIMLVAMVGIAQADERIQASNVGDDTVVYRIDEPNVKQAVTNYPGVLVQSGDLVSVSAGGCVQSGGHGKTWKRYVDPSGPNSPRLYHGLIQFPGSPMTRLQGLIGRVIVPRNPQPSPLQLGYEDDGYGDNGYTSHDDGTDDQCKDVGAAWLVLVVQHAKAPSRQAFQPIPSTPGVNGLPILTTDYQNPGFDTSASTWASRRCSGKKWLANATPRYEWTPVYDPTREYDDDAAGLSGLALFPADVAANGGLSKNDVPFTHPFGFDWETFIAPDPPFYTLLAPSNTGVSAVTDQAAGEYADAMARVTQLGLQAPKGVLGTETDRDLIPPIYRAREGDRIALFGRWIVDCGHEDFHSEIHPPLLFVKARAIPAGSSLDTPSNGVATETYSRVVARPYLVGQEFGDGALRTHLEKEVAKALSPIPLSNRIEAHPKAYQQPFSSVHLFSYVVRAPVLQPPATNALQSWVLVCKFHFTVRTGVAVQVTPQSSDSVKVFVSMNAASYKPARLPVRRDLNVTFSELKSEQPDTAAYINGTLAAGVLTRGPFDLLLARGILTDRYDAPIAASVHDGEITSVALNALGGGQQFSIDDDQPFPVYGWLSLEWQPRGNVQPTPPPVQPTPPPVTTIAVPDVTGTSQASASAALRAVGLSSGNIRPIFDCDNAGVVTSQSPRGGTQVAAGTSVNLVVGTNRDPNNPRRVCP
jgi:hypothetical protein